MQLVSGVLSKALAKLPLWRGEVTCDRLPPYDRHPAVPSSKPGLRNRLFESSAWRECVEELKIMIRMMKIIIWEFFNSKEHFLGRCSYIRG
jgi:hypothetical protein